MSQSTAEHPLNAFTVDVEDYFQVTAFEHRIQRADWDKYPHHVVENTQRLLELLAEHQVLGTFYILGWTAERYPALVRQIADAGHELASHSYWHRLVYDLSEDEFRSDLLRSRDAIEAATGIRVAGYRAPSFSITSKSTWALHVLAEEQFTCDSSVFPIVHDRYGIPDARPEIHNIQTSSGSICEFPPSVTNLLGVNLPVSGGGYFRLYPYRMSAYCLQQINRQGRPFMFYIHPWEIDPGQMRMDFVSRSTRFRHYINLKSTYAKLRRLLREFRFGRVADVLGHQANGTHALNTVNVG